MDDAILYTTVLVHAQGTMLRKEAFGSMLAGGNIPILNLNEDAVAIWELFDGQCSVAEIEAKLLNTYNDADVKATLLDFVRYCLHSGCLTLKNL